MPHAQRSKDFACDAGLEDRLRGWGFIGLFQIPIFDLNDVIVHCAWRPSHTMEIEVVLKRKSLIATFDHDRVVLVESSGQRREWKESRLARNSRWLSSE